MDTKPTIILTGGSGFLAKQIASSSTTVAKNIYLVSRSLNYEKPKSTSDANLRFITYSELSKIRQEVGFTLPIFLFHLASCNDSPSLSREEQLASNVALTRMLLAASETHDFEFIFISTIKRDKSNYAKTKRIAEKLVSQNKNNIVIRLPAILEKKTNIATKILYRINKNKKGVLYYFLKTFYPMLTVSDFIAIINKITSRATVDRDVQSDNLLYKGLACIVDKVAGLIMLCILVTIYPLCAFFSRAYFSSGALFIQKRTGKDFEEFSIFKLRTLPKETPSVATHELPLPALPAWFDVIRKLKIDELPQAINLLNGSMSLIGPRPCLPSQGELLELRAALNLTSAKPGITGWAQCNSITMQRPIKLSEYDSYYFDARSIYLDIKIMFKTVTKL